MLQVVPMTSQLPDNLRGVLPTGSDWQHRELQLSILDLYVALKLYFSMATSKIRANPTFPKMLFSFKTCSNTSFSGSLCIHMVEAEIKLQSDGSAFSTTCGTKESKTCNLGLTAPDAHGFHEPLSCDIPREVGSI